MGFAVTCIFLLSIFACLTHCGRPAWLTSLNLPSELAPYVVRNDKSLRKLCADPSEDCPYKEEMKLPKCFGYEDGCDFNQSYSSSTIDCFAPSNWRNARSPESQRFLFWQQADFGYVRERVTSMVDICASDTPVCQEGSSVRCSDHLKYCYVRNVFFDLKGFLAAKVNKQYRTDVIHKGEVGGKCTKQFYRDRLRDRADQKSYLQSWGDELNHFESYDDFAVDSVHCDVIFDRPTVVMKLDAAVNMYHHFCDFVNLYASMHINGSFPTDIDIVWWETHPAGFRDKMFGVTWKAFSDRTPVELRDLDGKKVCFREAMLPMLARQPFGLYYNMPLVDGCQGSGLMDAFSKHVLHRLAVKQHGMTKGKIRVTLLLRSTRFRRILNEDELVSALKTIGEFEVRRADYNARVPFLEQLNSTHNSDIFISMHGSGLTHLLFLPDWAAVFEIYHCDDKRCYSDLARLRGVKYRTWEKEAKVFPQDDGAHPTTGEPHKKFTNYAFDAAEFMRIVLELAEHVRSHKAFKAAQRRLSSPSFADHDEL